jgi:hypothetical protein
MRSITCIDDLASFRATGDGFAKVQAILHYEIRSDNPAKRPFSAVI